MPFPSAIADYTVLRGSASVPASYAANQYMVLGANTVVFAARVNQATFSAPFAQITFDTVTTGAYTDILEGMTVLISASSSARDAYFAGRVRKPATTTLLYINESAASISDNDYIFVLRDWRTWEKLARVSGAVYYKDWDLTYSAPKPVIYGLQSAYAGIVSGTPAGYTVAFSAAAVAVTSGATISSYAWTIPAGGTVTAGATNTANVTVRFDAAAAEYWVKLVVTDSGGRTATRWIPVWAVPADLSTTVNLGFSGAQLDGDIDNGWSGSVEAFAGVNGILDNTLCCVFDVEYYNGTATNIVGNVKFVGRLRTEDNSNRSDEQFSQVQTTRYTLESPFAQLARTSAPLIKCANDASPTVWDEITNLTPWRAICHLLQTHTTFLLTNSLSFDSTGNTYLYDTFPTQGQSIIEVIQDILGSINAAMEFAQAGEARIARDARYLSSVERDALVTVASFTEADWIEFSYAHDHLDKVGQIKGYAGSYNGTTGKVAIVASYWPGVAQGSAPGRSVFNGQILTANQSAVAAQAELNQRIGYKAAVENARSELQVTFPDGYNWLTPSVYQWYTFTITSSDNLAGRSITTATRWLCKSVSISHNNETGTKEVSAVFAEETRSTAGRTYIPPAANTIAPVIPGIPAFNPYPAFPDLPIIIPALPDPGTLPPYIGPVSPVDDPLLRDGNEAIAWNSDIFNSVANLINAAAPTYQEGNPTDVSSGVVEARLSGFADSKAYLLLGVGSGGTWEQIFDLTASSGGWAAVVDPVNGGVVGSYSAGTGFLTRYYPAFGDDVSMQISLSFSAANITEVTAWVTGVSPSGAASGVYVRYGGYNKTIIAQDNPLQAGAVQYTLSFNVTRSDLTIQIYSLGTATQTLTKLRLRGTGANPFTSGTSSSVYRHENVFASDAVNNWSAGVDLGIGYTLLKTTSTQDALYVYEPSGATVRYSTDGGATWGTAIDLLTSPGSFGGFDTIRIGVSSLAAADGTVLVATTAGGAYSAYATMPTGAQAGCIVIPRYQFGSTSVGNTATSTPQFLVGSPALTAGNAALWKVTGSGATFTDITPYDGAHYGTVVSANALAMPWYSGSIIAGLFDFNGTRKLCVSINAGASWTIKTTGIDAAADYIQFRKGDKTMRQLFFANGDHIVYSKDRGVTLATRTYPQASIAGVQVYG